MRTAIATNARRAGEPCGGEFCYGGAWVPPRIDAILSAILGQHSDRRSARKQANARPLLLDHPKRPQDHDLPRGGGTRLQHQADRKSTRLNSSHLGISYAVFCLKK